MKKIISVLAFILFAPAMIFAQGPETYQKQVIECLGTEGDGSQTLRVTGTGRNKRDAEEQAKKDAVMAVIFDGIRSGLNGCDMRPILSELDAKRKYEDYFHTFFLDKGPYSEYVTMQDSRRGSKVKSKSMAFLNYRVTVRVYRNDIKHRLIKDGVLKIK